MVSSQSIRFHLQGVTEVVHGFQFVDWVTIRVEDRVNIIGSPRR